MNGKFREGEECRVTRVGLREAQWVTKLERQVGATSWRALKPQPGTEPDPLGQKEPLKDFERLELSELFIGRNSWDSEENGLEV